jgi:hypothetical protein
MKRRYGEKVYPDYLLIATLSLVFCVGLVHEGMPRGHDLIYEITRVAEYTNSLKDGGFPVRWSKNLEGGYGEPIFNFFPPLFLIVSAIQIFLGLPVTLAIKVSIFFFTLAGGLGMYLLAKEFYNRNGALLAASIYIVAPYHIVDIYVRSAYSEYTACSIVPFVFWGIALVCQDKNFNSRSIVLLSTTGTLFALSHILSLLMYIPLLVIFFLLNMALNRNWKSLLSISLAGVLTFCLSAFYILPVLLEKEFVQTWQLTIGKFDILKNFATAGSLFGMSSWYSLTPLSLILFVLILAAMIFKKRRINKTLYANLVFFLGALVILVYMTTASSRAIWEAFPSMKIFQFPWRLLSPVTFVLCFLAGSITYLKESYVRLFPRAKNESDSMFVLPVVILGLFIVGAICVFFLLGNSSRYMIVHDTEFTPENIREKNLRATVLFEYRPIWAREKHVLPLGKGLVSSSSEAKIKQIKIRTRIREYKVSLPEKCTMTANVHYFPGWEIFDNGNPVNFRISTQGLMDFTLPAGTHYLKMVFKNTSVRKAGNFLSILGLLGFGGLVIAGLKTL